MTQSKTLVVLATRNAGKIKEFAHGMGTERYEFKVLPDVGFTENIVEDGRTFAENAAIKAKAVSEWLARRGIRAMVLADDSGLEVNALGGAPGIYTARYAGEHGNDKKNYEKLLKDIESAEDRGARFVCALCLQCPGALPRLFEGECRGTIARAPAGESGFGYDPVFVPEGHSRTFAQMSLDEKKSMSHRGNAIRKMMESIGCV